MQMNELQAALDKVKISLMTQKDCAFITTIVFSLKQIWDDTCDTAYTDSKVIGWNPDFFMKMDPAERLFVMVHEAWHVAYDHMGRLLGRKHNVWNAACDYVINLMLVERGFQMPKVGLLDKQYAGMSADQVYDILIQQPQPPECPMPDLRGSGMTPEEHQRHVESIVVRASIQSKMQGDKPGTIPGEIQLFLDNLFQPKLPWRTILHRYITQLAKVDYTWKKPNRRFFPDHHLPSLDGKTVIDLDFYVDISGSVSDHQFKAFASEIAGVLKMMKPRRIRVIQFDTRICHIDEVKSLGDLMKIEFTGRGGTDVECILDMIETEKVKLSMVFTDGGFNWRRNSIKQNVLWLINDHPKWNPQANCGKAIHFSTKDYK